MESAASRAVEVEKGIKIQYREWEFYTWLRFNFVALFPALTFTNR